MPATKTSRLFRPSILLRALGLLLMATPLAVLPFGRVGVLVAGSATAVFSFLFPGYALGLVGFTVPFGELFKIPVAGFSVTATELVVVLLSLALCARCSVHQRLLLCSLRLWIPLGTFLAIALWATTEAVSLALSTKELVKWLEFGVVLTLAASLPQSAGEVRIIVSALLLAGAAQALYGLSQAITTTGPVGFLLGGGVLRAFGTFGQPNPFAAYLASLLSLGFGVGVGVFTRDRSRFLTPFGVLVMASSTIMFLGLVASLSRAAWIALATAVALMAALHNRRALLYLGLAVLIAGLLLVVGAFGFLPPFLASRFTVLFENFALFDARSVPLTSQNFALVQRMAIWQAAWAMFLDNPMLGVGPGNFNSAYPQYALPGWPQLPGHAHNYYLNLLAEVGLLGLGAYLVLLASLGAFAFTAMKRIRLLSSKDPGDNDTSLLYGIALGSVGLVAMLTIHHLFDNLYVHGMVALIGLVVGLSAAARHIALGERWNRHSSLKTSA